MAFIPIPLGMRLQARATYQGQQVENTFTYTSTFGWGQDELDAATAAFGESWSTNVLPLLSDQYNFTEAYARGEREVLDFESVNSDFAGVGGDTSVPLPGNVAFCISRRTGIAGRSGRGRVYLVGISTNQLLSANILLTASANAMVDALAQVKADMQSEGWTEVIASFQTNGVPNDPAAVRTVTVYEAVDTNLDSQRRRLNGRGT